MSGSFERQIYDTKAYEIALKQSTKPALWQLDPTRFDHCNRCRPSDVGNLSCQGVSLTTEQPLVDVESELLRLNYRHSHNPRVLYKPKCKKNMMTSGYPCGHNCCSDKLVHFKDCAIGQEYTRLTVPSCTLRETGWNRFQPICINPQDRCRWEHPSEIGINYRMVVKDNQVPCMPIPLSSNKLEGGADFNLSSS